MREIVEKSGKFLASHICDFVFEHHCADVPRLVELRLFLPLLPEVMFMPVYGVEKFENTAVAVAVSVATLSTLSFFFACSLLMISSMVLVSLSVIIKTMR